MKLPTLRMAVLVLLVVIGCHGSDSPMEPELAVPDLPLFDVYDMDCQLSPERCGAIQAGIDAMKVHPNPTCRYYGELAQDRYDAAPGVAGFREQSQYQEKDMSVYVNQPDGYTNVYPHFWGTPYSSQDVPTGALVVHEEVHHETGSADETYPNRVQEACLNWQP